jgi:pimeloyl-ACP methyl ester carboxylesterase
LAEVAGPDGPIETLVAGSGEPTTIFAHGFAGSIGETRPFASGIDGTKVFFHFRGHGLTVGAAAPWGYESLEAELSVVRAAYAARRGVGVSIGSGALLAAAVRDPGVFERLVLVLPPAIDRPREGHTLERIEAMARRADDGDIDGLTQLLLAEQPAAVRDGRMVQMWARQQATRMTGTALTSVIREVPHVFPIADRTVLAGIQCPVLVIGHEGDEAHPAELVGELVDILPNATGRVYSAGGVLWTHRSELRDLMRSFLNR